jgi:ADP-ribosylglycohydrolase
MDALRKSIHLGGDVDSVASITTAIMASRTSLKSIPLFMLENVEGKKYLEKVEADFSAWLKQN